MSDGQYFIIYFPYLFMRDVPEIDFGFLKIWNFYLLKDKYIPDEKIKTKVEKILGIYQDFFWGTIKGMGIISIGDTDFRRFSEEDMEKVRLAKLMLFLCFLSKNNTIEFNPNTGHQMASSENFSPIYQNFRLEDDYITAFDGYVLPSYEGGLDINKIKYFRPSSVPAPSRFDIDKDLLKYLLELKNQKPKVFERIINATEVLFESYFNSFVVSANARVLLQMSALEILLNLPEKDQRKYFKERVEKELTFSEDKKYVYYSERLNKPKQREVMTLKGIWADSFYMLRNHIVHGLTPKKSEYLFKKKQLHTSIAFLFFLLFLKKQINKSLRKKIFEYEIKWKKWHDDTFSKDREEFVYEKSFRSLWEKARRAQLKRINWLKTKVS